MATHSHLRRLELTSVGEPLSDVTSFDSLYELHVDHALRLAGLLCGGRREQAEDAVAEVLPKWRSRSVDDFWAYLRTALVNEIRNGHRRRGVADRRRHRTHTSDRLSPAEDQVTERQRVAAALAELPVRQRTAVVLRYLEDLSEREAAALMGCEVGTVKSATSRGVARLRELLAEEDR